LAAKARMEHIEETGFLLSLRAFAADQFVVYAFAVAY
jgi:hypothetical protein